MIELGVAGEGVDLLKMLHLPGSTDGRIIQEDVRIGGVATPGLGVVRADFDSIFSFMDARLKR
jgi:hypothetical protein